MIAYPEIELESARAGVSPQTIEKDYHLDWYLAALALENIFPGFVFYGGTAIKKLYVTGHRFSEDIDLISGKKLSGGDIAKALDRAHRFLEKEANLFYSYEPGQIETRGTQTRFLIHYRGFSEIGGIKRFLLDLVQGIEELPKPVSKILVSGYRDLQAKKIRIPAMPLEVICADKLALIVDRKRKEPRDIYDLWSAFMHVKAFDRRLFLSRYQKTLAYKTSFAVVRSSFKDMDFKRSWEVRLRHQVPSLPDFDIVVYELLEKLEPLLK